MLFVSLRKIFVMVNCYVNDRNFCIYCQLVINDVV